MSRRVTIYVIFHDGVFVDVFASYSEAVLNLHRASGFSYTVPGWEIRKFEREDY